MNQLSFNLKKNNFRKSLRQLWWNTAYCIKLLFWALELGIVLWLEIYKGLLQAARAWKEVKGHTKRNVMPFTTVAKSRIPPRLNPRSITYWLIVSKLFNLWDLTFLIWTWGIIIPNRRDKWLLNKMVKGLNRVVEKLTDDTASARPSCPNLSCCLTPCSANNDIAELVRLCNSCSCSTEHACHVAPAGPQATVVLS